MQQTFPKPPCDPRLRPNPEKRSELLGFSCRLVTYRAIGQCASKDPFAFTDIRNPEKMIWIVGFGFKDVLNCLNRRKVLECAHSLFGAVRRKASAREERLDLAGRETLHEANSSLIWREFPRVVEPFHARWHESALLRRASGLRSCFFGWQNLLFGEGKASLDGREPTDPSANF